MPAATSRRGRKEGAHDRSPRQDFERFTGPELAAEDDAPAASSGPPDNARLPIGVVLEISGSGSQIAFDLQRINECMADPDPSVALAGQVGSQIKIRVGDAWLLASVRDQRRTAAPKVGSSPISTSSAKAARKS